MNLWMIGEAVHIFLLCFIGKTKQHYFICNTPTLDMEFWGFKMFMLLKFCTFLSVAYWIFSSVFCSHLIQIQKIISVNFWNSVNIWPIWWEDVCYGHQLIEFCENCNQCWGKFLGFRYVVVYWQIQINSCHWAQQCTL